MKQNQLGKSDIFVSNLTLGCMSLGTNQKKATKMIDYALDAGINHLDTADLYDFGKNEEIIGQAIKHKREQVVLTSKVGNHFNAETKDWFWDPSKEHITSGLKNSLKRLHTDYIDLYMLHGGTIEDSIDETIYVFETLKKEGLIRAYGISSIRPNVIREYVKRSNIDAVMMQYNIFDRRPEEEILNLLHEQQISVLARGPLAKGMLSNQGMEIIMNKGKKGYLDYSYEELVKMYKQLQQLINNNESINELALQYVLTHPAIATAVFGASSIQQIEENIRVHPSKLADDLYMKIQQITKPIQYINHR